MYFLAAEIPRKWFVGDANVRCIEQLCATSDPQCYIVVWLLWHQHHEPINHKLNWAKSHIPVPTYFAMKLVWEHRVHVGTLVPPHHPSLIHLWSCFGKTKTRWNPNTAEWPAFCQSNTVLARMSPDMSLYWNGRGGASSILGSNLIHLIPPYSVCIKRSCSCCSFAPETMRKPWSIPIYSSDSEQRETNAAVLAQIPATTQIITQVYR